MSLTKRTFSAASRHAHGGEEDSSLQTGKSGDVRLGNKGAAGEPEGVRTPQHTLRQFGQQDTEEQRGLAGSAGDAANVSPR